MIITIFYGLFPYSFIHSFSVIVAKKGANVIYACIIKSEYESHFDATVCNFAYGTLDPVYSVVVIVMVVVVVVVWCTIYNTSQIKVQISKFIRLSSHYRGLKIHIRDTVSEQNGAIEYNVFSQCITVFTFRSTTAVRHLYKHILLD